LPEQIDFPRRDKRDGQPGTNGISDHRIGLVGYGSWAREALVPALSMDGRAKVVAVAAPTKGTRELARQELASGLRTYPGIEGLLAEEPLDAVMIAVPDHLHEHALLAALGSEVPVFYEPPLSDRRERIIPVIDRLLAANHVTFADLELGLIPVVARASQMVEGGALGGIQRAEISLESGWGPVPDYDLCNFHHLCTWYVDVLNRILGSTPRRVLLLDGHGTPGRRQNAFVGHLQYDGIWGTLRANIASVGELRVRVDVAADDGDLRVNLLSGELRYRTRHAPEWTVEHCPAISPHASWPGVHESVSAFLDAVEAGESAVNTAEVVGQLHWVGLAAEESKDTGAWAEVGRLNPDRSTRYPAGG